MPPVPKHADREVACFLEIGSGIENFFRTPLFQTQVSGICAQSGLVLFQSACVPVSFPRPLSVFLELPHTTRHESVDDRLVGWFIPATTITIEDIIGKFNLCQIDKK